LLLLALLCAKVAPGRERNVLVTAVFLVIVSLLRLVADRAIGVVRHPLGGLCSLGPLLEPPEKLGEVLLRAVLGIMFIDEAHLRLAWLARGIKIEESGRFSLVLSLEVLYARLVGLLFDFLGFVLFSRRCAKSCLHVGELLFRCTEVPAGHELSGLERIRGEG